MLYLFRFFFFIVAFPLLSFENPPKVSVISPTYNRPERHANLYLAFTNQTYQNKELLVMDDSPSPSPFFTQLKDERVTYIYQSEKKQIGTKRNILCEKAKGEIIAHFDDDDFYAPNYLEKMISELGSADLIKLSTWLAWRETDGSLWEWETATTGSNHYTVSGWKLNTPMIDLKQVIGPKNIDEFTDKNVWGYGFSYLYRKSLWEQCPFEDISQAEDYQFILKARSLGKLLINIPDTEHLVLHILQQQSSSKIFPQKRVDAAFVKGLKEAEPWLVVQNSD